LIETYGGKNANAQNTKTHRGTKEVALHENHVVAGRTGPTVPANVDILYLSLWDLANE